MEKRIHNRVISRAFSFVVFSAATWFFCLPVAFADMTGTDKGGDSSVVGR